ncbi:DUF397 domain-containing protein [Catenuloplanes sp. NPDC051500]|uniref:DUF397 domain-containing protein n=1 Tax=Catenuloplanes sp. NPDC051500 TaxID=3363959 RepID=UPI0037B124CE
MNPYEKYADVDPTQLDGHVSTRSGGSGNCVRVARHDGHVFVTDTKDPSRAPMIYTAAEWDAFLGGAKDGEFDL